MRDARGGETIVDLRLRARMEKRTRNFELRRVRDVPSLTLQF